MDLGTLSILTNDTCPGLPLRDENGGLSGLVLTESY